MADIQFKSTLWTLIRKANAQETQALDDFVHRYRRPVLAFIAQRGFGPEETEDLCQDVFLRIIEKDVLNKVDADKGRFRSFLLGLTKHVLQEHVRKQAALKRGGDRNILSLDQPLDSEDQTRAEGLPDKQEEEDFDRLWVKNLIELALRSLEKESLKRSTQYHQVVKGVLFDKKDQASLAKELGCPVAQIQQALFQGRKKLQQYIRDEMGEYAANRTEFEEERRFLKKFMAAQDN